uniref:Uncharacterized protein n=1 Tax=Clastoptera arizonana TaxID=38151 RepID=A0A1B6CTT8_9HEMI
MLTQSKLSTAKRIITEMDTKYLKQITSGTKLHSVNNSTKLDKMKQLKLSSNISSDDSEIKDLSIKYNEIKHNSKIEILKEHENESSILMRPPVPDLKLNSDIGTKNNIDQKKPIQIFRSKMLENVFIISSSDEEEISEDINLYGNNDHKPSISARTISEDITPSDTIKRGSPNSIKFIHINTPIIYEEDSDRNISTEEKEDVHEKDSSESDYIYVNRKYSSKGNSSSESSSSKMKLYKENKLKSVSNSYKSSTESKYDKNTDAKLDFDKINKMDSTFMKSENTRQKSKCTQTSLLEETKHLKYIKEAYGEKIQTKININNRPVLRASALCKPIVVEVCDSKFIPEISNILNDENDLSLELEIKELLKQQVLITRQLIETHHQLYLNCCKFVHDSSILNNAHNTDNR